MSQAKLFLGDCLEVMGGMEDNSIDFCFTDPPYGHLNNSHGDLISRFEHAKGWDKRNIPKGATNGRPILNDGKEADLLFQKAIKQIARLLKPGAVCCCCGGGGGPSPQFARWSLWMEEVLTFKQMVCWDKGPMGLGWHYRRSYETVLVASKKGAPCQWFDTSGVIENIIRPGNYGVHKIIPNKTQHPTEKPVGLASLFIKLHTKKDMVVMDPFMGHGSTGEAAIKAGRKFIGVELDEKFFARAEKRIRTVEKRMLRSFGG